MAPSTAQPPSFPGSREGANGTPVSISAPITQTTKPSTFVIPISVNDTTGRGIIAFQFHLIYSPSVIDPSGSNFGCSTAGTIAGAAGHSATCNVMPDGTLQVSVSGANPVAGSGTILKITFTTDAAASLGNISPLNFANVAFYNGSGVVQTTSNNGQVTIVGPTAGEVSISGRVLSDVGRGFNNVGITVSGGSLVNPVNTSTNRRGEYRVDGLTAGETYLVTVASRRMRFSGASRLVTLTDDLVGFDFTVH